MTFVAALLMALFLPGTASAADYKNQIVKVGINSPLRSAYPSVPYITLKNATGFKVGQFDANRQFSASNSLGATTITVQPSYGGFVIMGASGETLLSLSSSKIGVMPVSATEAGTTYTRPSGYGASAAYYGGFELVLSASGGVMSVINYVDIDDYVKGVIPYEVSASWALEALKAQAVCARTYALYNKNGASSYGFDVCNTSYNQVYGGVYTRDGTYYKDRTDSAVNATSGECILYNGSLISAMYSAASGGATEDSENLYGNVVPYLRGVEDTYEQTPSTYTYSGSFTAAELYSKVQSRISGLYDIADVDCTYTRMGNMLSVTFTDSYGNTKTYSKADCLTLLRSFTAYTSLRFTITMDSSTGLYTVSSKGSGHNLGMSQYGAKGMAEAGFTYDEILFHYYTGITLASGKTKPVDPGPGEDGFTDVKQGDWFYDAVMFVVNHEPVLFRGTSDTIFAPDTPMTRAMFVTVLGRAAEIDDSAFASGSSFSDVPSGKYYTGYVAWAAQNGIVNGYSDGTFHPESTVNREEMCVMLGRFARLQNVTLKTDSTTPAFTDAASISSWATEDVDAMRLAGIVSGKGSGVFAPKDPCRRAEVAKVLMSFLTDNR
jgi:stage II sporulation protein D